MEQIILNTALKYVVAGLSREEKGLLLEALLEGNGAAEWDISEAGAADGGRGDEKETAVPAAVRGNPAVENVYRYIWVQQQEYAAKKKKMRLLGAKGAAARQSAAAGGKSPRNQQQLSFAMDKAGEREPGGNLSFSGGETAAESFVGAQTAGGEKNGRPPFSETPENIATDNKRDSGGAAALEGDVLKRKEAKENIINKKNNLFFGFWKKKSGECRENRPCAAGAVLPATNIPGGGTGDCAAALSGGGRDAGAEGTGDCAAALSGGGRGAGAEGTGDCAAALSGGGRGAGDVSLSGEPGARGTEFAAGQAKTLEPVPVPVPHSMQTPALAPVPHSMQMQMETSGSKKRRRQKSVLPSAAEPPLFQPPTVAAVQAFVTEENLQVDAGTFVDFYDSHGWCVGKTAIKNWKATARLWHRRAVASSVSGGGGSAGISPPGRIFDDEAYWSELEARVGRRG